MSNSQPIGCPHCHSPNVVSMNHGRKSAVMLGGLAGGISSAASVWHGARLGAAVGSVAGPTGSLLSAVAGAVLAALAGSAAGCAAGAVVGDLIDDKVLNKYRCLDCDHRFSRASTPVPQGASSEMARQPGRDSPHSHDHLQSARQSHAFEAVHFPMDDDEEPYGFYRPFHHPFQHNAFGTAEHG
jgi:hypothetical protein